MMPDPIELLDPAHRAEVLIGCAGVALHGILAGGSDRGGTAESLVTRAFELAGAFLAAAERVAIEEKEQLNV